MSTQLTVALLANCTTELLTPILLDELKRCGVDARLWSAGFNQYRQELLDAESGFYRADPQLAILCLDGEDLFRDVLADPLSFDRQQRRERVEAAISEVGELVNGASARLPRTTFLLNTIAVPPVHALTGLEYNTGHSVWDLASEYNQRLGEFARRNGKVIVIDTASLMSLAGYRLWHDPRLWCLARSRWSRPAMRMAAGRYAAAVLTLTGRVRKCLVLDLDDTLWGGILGEDGIEGITLGEEGLGLAFAEFQIELLNLRRKGVLLAIASKNNADEALAVLRSHPAMRLREEHFASLRINWDDKAANLRAIAAELDIGLDSLVFIDDCPAERALVRTRLPEVLVPEWPSDPAEYRMALLELAATHFYRVRITEEDFTRGESYRLQAERRKLASEAASIEDYYRSLSMSARIGFADGVTIPRIAQIVQKTNQFNLTTRRYTEAEVAYFASARDAMALWLELDDRFGPNGLVGVMILRQQDSSAWRIDTLLLSCRVIGRTAENTFLAQACKLVRERGGTRLFGEYRPSARNAVAAELYAKLGFQPAGQSEESALWELDLSSSDIPMPAWIEVQCAPGSTHA